MQPIVFLPAHLLALLPGKHGIRVLQYMSLPALLGRTRGYTEHKEPLSQL